MSIKIFRNKMDLTPSQTLVFGFAIVIFWGAVLLVLPISSRDGTSIGFINALFTSASAVCVTGLVVVDTLHWTLFGQIVIIILIQIGGLGVMTFATAFFILLGKKITLKERLLIQESLNQYSLAGMVRLTKKIIFGSLLFDCVGSILLSFRFIPDYVFMKGMFLSVFHSISAFCNAGFDITSGNSMCDYVGNPLINFVLMALIILGGLGFAVWWDLINVFRKYFKKEYSLKKAFQKLSLHSKLVLVITFVLIFGGGLFFFIVEYNNTGTLGELNLQGKTFGALFQSVTTRTAGFNSIKQEELSHASAFMTIILMFIGGSPAGTAGGIKTVTMGILILSVASVVRGRERTEAFNRTIPLDIIQRGLAVIIISLGVVISVTMMLSISEQGDFLDIFFESVSAFATVGLSRGLTNNLTDFGKIIISITMFIGRLGPVSMALAFSLKRNSQKVKIKKPEERVMVG